jgi:hypothetical protein
MQLSRLSFLRLRLRPSNLETRINTKKNYFGGEMPTAFGKRITSEHHGNHHFRTLPFFITSEHHISHHC